MTFGDSAFPFSWPHLSFSQLCRRPKINSLLKERQHGGFFLKGRQCQGSASTPSMMAPLLASVPTLCPTFVLGSLLAQCSICCWPLSAAAREPGSTSKGLAGCSTKEGTFVFFLCPPRPCTTVSLTGTFLHSQQKLPSDHPLMLLCSSVFLNWKNVRTALKEKILTHFPRNGCQLPMQKSLDFIINKSVI